MLKGFANPYVIILTLHVNIFDIFVCITLHYNS